MLLPDQIIKSLRPIFAGEDFVAHWVNLTRRSAKQKQKSPPGMFREERRWRQRLSLAFDLELFRIDHFSALPDFGLILSRRKPCLRRFEREAALVFVGIGFARCDEMIWRRGASGV